MSYFYPNNWRVACALFCAGTILSSSPPLEARELGIDVSSFQGTIDWTQVKAAGKVFAFVRAMHGLPGNPASPGGSVAGDDTKFIANMNGAGANAILAGAYAYAQPEYDTPAAEATHFVSLAGSYMTAGWLVPVLDIEETAGSGQTIQGATTLSGWVNAFCADVKSSTGVDPIIYCNTNYAYNLLDRSVNVHKLWLARPHTTPYAPQTDTPQTPSGFNNPYGVWNSTTTGAPDNPGPWSFWQYGQSVNDTSGVPGISGNVDLDVFHSETAAISSFVIPEPGTGLMLLTGAALVLRRRRK